MSRRSRARILCSALISGMVSGAAWAQAPVVGAAQPSVAQASTTQPSNGRVRAEVVTQTSVRRTPDPASDPLGVYRPGTRLVVVRAGIPGWYRVDFPQEVKGTRIGWIAAADVELLNPDGSRISPSLVPGAPKAPMQNSSNQGGSKKKGEPQSTGGFPYQYRRVSLGLIGAGWFFTPADVQTLLREPTTKATGLRFGFEVQYQPQRSLGGALQFFYGKGTVGGLSVNGFEVRLLANYEFLGLGGWRFGVGLGPIGTFYSATMTSGTAEIKTVGIISGGAVGMLQVTRFFSSRISLGLGAGYQLLSLSQVPAIDATPPVSLDAKSNINLSGPTGQFALRFHL